MFNVDVVKFINLFFVDCPFDVLSKKSLPNPRSQRFSRSFIVSGNIFRSLILFELLFAVQETQVLSLSQEDPLEKGMATQSNILAWRIPVDRGA